MDTTMLKGDSIQALMQLVRRMFLEIHTCVPGEIISFDREKQTAVVKSCIRNTIISEDGQVSYVDNPQIIDVPVFFPHSTSSGFSITYPVAEGDQCLLFFSERSYDNWLISGSIQNPIESREPRSHQYNDAFALVGISPYVSSITDFIENSIEIRNSDRKVRISLNDDQIQIFNDKIEILLEKDQLTCSYKYSNKNAIIQIDRDGNINLSTNNNINVSGSTVNCSADYVDVIGKTISCLGHDINVTGYSGTVVFQKQLSIDCPTILIDGNVQIGGEIYAQTYLVGPDPNQEVGVIAGNDKRITRPDIYNKEDTDG